MKPAIVIYLIFVFGILWHSIPLTLTYVLYLTPWVLLIAYVIVLFPEWKNKNHRVLIWLAGVYFVTFLIEVIGVKTGMIFGPYKYGETLGIHILDTPLIIGMNWGMIIWGSVILAERIKVPVIIKIIVASSAAVLLDILIEPAAVILDYWQWDSGIIPLRNYIAWFMIALIFSASYFLFRIRTENQLPIHFLLSQFIFFSGINLIKV